MALQMGRIGNKPILRYHSQTGYPSLCLTTVADDHFLST